MKRNDARNWFIVFAILGIGTYLAKKMFLSYIPSGVTEFNSLINSFYGMTDTIIYVSIFFVIIFFLLYIAGDKNAVPNRNGPKQ